MASQRTWDCRRSKKPVLERWSDLDQFTPPFEQIKKRDLDYIDNYCEQSEKFIISPVAARPFERLQWLRGTENALIDIVDNSAELQKLLGIIHEYNLKDIRSWCKTNIDAITLADDWGTNLSLIIDPLIWNSVFKPLYKEYCRIIHNANKYVFFHSDGNIQSIFQDLVEIGVDAINSQLFVMDIEALASRYRGKVTLWGEIDQYQVLSTGTSRDVHNAVMRVRRVFDNGSGGLIAQCSWVRGFPVENIRAVFSTWNEPLEIT